MNCSTLKTASTNSGRRNRPSAPKPIDPSQATTLSTKKPPRCQTVSDYSKVLLSGMLWSIGNFSMLLMVSRIGIGKGFAFAQLCVIVNALIGIFLFKEPAIQSRAAKWVLLGIALAATGSIGLGNLKEGM